jgi:hypothetical protein
MRGITVVPARQVAKIVPQRAARIKRSRSEMYVDSRLFAGLRPGSTIPPESRNRIGEYRTRLLGSCSCGKTSKRSRTLVNTRLRPGFMQLLFPPAAKLRTRAIEHWDRALVIIKRNSPTDSDWPHSFGTIDDDSDFAIARRNIRGRPENDIRRPDCGERV